MELYTQRFMDTMDKIFKQALEDRERLTSEEKLESLKRCGILGPDGCLADFYKSENNLDST